MGANNSASKRKEIPRSTNGDTVFVYRQHGGVSSSSTPSSSINFRDQQQAKSSKPQTTTHTMYPRPGNPVLSDRNRPTPSNSHSKDPTSITNTQKASATLWSFPGESVPIASRRPISVESSSCNSSSNKDHHSSLYTLSSINSTVSSKPSSTSRPTSQDVQKAKLPQASGDFNSVQRELLAYWNQKLPSINDSQLRQNLSSPYEVTKSSSYQKDLASYAPLQKQNPIHQLVPHIEQKNSKSTFLNQCDEVPNHHSNPQSVYSKGFGIKDFTQDYPMPQTSVNRASQQTSEHGMLKGEDCIRNKSMINQTKSLQIPEFVKPKSTKIASSGSIPKHHQVEEVPYNYQKSRLNKSNIYEKDFAQNVQMLQKSKIDLKNVPGQQEEKELPKRIWSYDNFSEEPINEPLHTPNFFQQQNIACSNSYSVPNQRHTDFQTHEECVALPHSQVPQSRKKYEGPGKKLEKFPKRERQKSHMHWKQKREEQKDRTATKTLFSYSRTQSKPDLIIFSDSEPDSISTANTCDFDSEEFSEDGSSFCFDEDKDEAITLSPTTDFTSQLRNESGNYISVFWDIENCPVPHNKSAVDIVKKIRDTFFGNYTQKEFCVACDSRNLNENIAKELNESGVSIIHASSKAKNAADQKLKLFLQRFQYEFRMSRSAIVLVSGDSDFAADLSEMRYMHHIYVNLVCNKQARKALMAAAHVCIKFEEFVKDLPDREKLETQKFSVLVSNFAPKAKKYAIKMQLLNRMNGIANIKCNIRMLSQSQAHISFANEISYTEAVPLLENYVMFGHRLSVMSVDTAGPETSINNLPHATSVQEVNFPLKKKRARANKKKHVNRMQCSSHDLPVEQSNDCMKNSSLEQGKDSKDSNEKMKEATLIIAVYKRHDDTTYWQNELEEVLQSNEFAVQILEHSGCIDVKFQSVNKAKAAKKLLVKHVKFSACSQVLELTREGSEASCIRPSSNLDFHLGKKKIEDAIQLIQNRKAKCLEEFENQCLTLKDAKDSDVEVFQAKWNELNEQKVTFCAFTGKVLKTFESFDITETDLDVRLRDLLTDYSLECACFRSALPVYARKSRIIQKIKSNQVTIIQAETGSGKSTQICQYLWREGFGENGLIVCTQPRKIAAVSLAKHVSSQVGSCVGSVVGYQVGQSKKRSDKTKIMYVTDFVMLKMCVEDPSFSSISCIVVDEAHERSIYTDLLLGMVKKCLLTRRDLKVIITSATIKTQLFLEYFNLPDSAVLSVSGRTFPIEDVWLDKDVKIGENYLGRTVDVAFSLLVEKPGDVLAFLATPVETEKAVQKFNELMQSTNCKSKVSLHQLHGQLDHMEQQKIFEKTSRDTRKIVFSTNCAETSITIPGIKYVVDSGMVKEARFDSTRNLNVLTIGFVNKSSAEQRRGRAGRTQNGKCYRLYSKSNYEKMEDSMVPEILRVNLGQALLKLILLGVQNPFAFDFVESPLPKSMKKAMDQLIHLGAISKDIKLTDLGVKMAVLPLEPRLCYIIMKGIEYGIGYDAVAVAALATVSRNIFFRNAENKEQSDTNKIRFCQPESDFFTFLEIYKEWVSVPKTQKSRWCVLNCINGKSMRVAHDLVNELIQNLLHDLKIKVNTKFSEMENILNCLHDLIFQSFSANICIFSGHWRFGYLSQIIDGNLQVHPSSSICSLGNWRPQYIVYDSILETSQTFLINVTCVKQTFLENAVKCGLIQINLDEMKSKVLELCPFGPYGEVVLKNFVGRKGANVKDIEKKLKERCKTERCIIETDFNTGYLNAFILPVNRIHAKTIIRPHVKEVFTKLREQEKLIGNIQGLVNSDAIFGLGAEIKELILPGEYREVRIKPPDCDTEEVRRELSIYGEIKFVKQFKQFKKVTFCNFTSASKAVKLFGKEKNFSVQPFIKFDMSKPSKPFFKVLLLMNRRPCIRNAFFSVTPETSFAEASYAVLNKTVSYRLNPLRILFSKKCATDFIIRNLPNIVNDLELRQILNSLLPSGIEVNKLIVVRAREFESTNQDIGIQKSTIARLFANLAPGRIEVDLKKPHPKDKYWQAIVYFDDAKAGQLAVSHIKSLNYHNDTLINQIVEVKPILEAELFCRRDIYSAIESHLKDALQFFNCGSVKRDNLKIETLERGENTILLKISGNSFTDVIDARKALQSCIQGDSLEFSENAKEQLFSGKGTAFLKKLNSDNPNSYTFLNFRSRTVSVFGSEASCTVVKRKINEYLDKLGFDFCAEILLRSSRSQRSALKTVLKSYGSDLKKLKVEFRLTRAEINVYKHILYVYGDENALNQCRKKIADLLVELNNEERTNNEYQDECPVCCDEVTAPFYRLQCCGHAYCEDCILFQLQTDEIPITCCKKECSSFFTLVDLEWVFAKNKSLEVKIQSKAFDAFMKKSTNLKFCPTPDCSMVYRTAECLLTECRYVCPSCQNTICTRCGMLYHHGMACDFYKHAKVDVDYSLKVWLKENPEYRKICPKCRSPIEKIGGCNYVTCGRCECHMCWLCLKVFATGDDVYRHQPYCSAVRH